MEPYLRDHEISEIFARRWRVDCLRMELFGQRSGKIAYQGAGEVRFAEDGTLEYVLYDTTTSVGIEQVLASAGMPDGTWLGPEHFYLLRATDWRGRTWTAEWLDADTHSNSDLPGASVRGKIRELRCAPRPAEPAKTLLLLAETTSELPANAGTRTLVDAAGVQSEQVERNIWKTHTALGDLYAFKSGNVLRLTVESTVAEIGIDAALRIEEAVSFVLGRQIRWTIERVGLPSPSVVVRSVREPLRHPRLGPPVEFGTPEGVTAADALFKTYLAYVLGSSPGANKRHALAVALSNVMRGSSAVLEDESLAVSVQVESIVRQYFGDRGIPDAIVLQEVQSIVEHIGQWSGNSHIKDRAAKMVANMQGVSVETALKRLVSEGVISDEHRRAWREQRHPSAHGAVRQLDVKKTVERNEWVFDLFLRLTFNLVGYSGVYSDHRSPGWPLRQL